MSQNVKNLEELKISIIENIDNQSSEAINIAKKILKNPEPGFREYKTSQIVKNEFKKIGIRYEADIALTGVKAKLTTGKPGPTIAVIGELDSLIVKGHEFADPETLAAHACVRNDALHMEGGVWSLDGKTSVRKQVTVNIKEPIEYVVDANELVAIAIPANHDKSEYVAAQRHSGPK